MKKEEVEMLSEFSMPIIIGKTFSVEQTKKFIELFFKAIDELRGNQNKESEGKPMLHKITVTKTEEKVLKEYWCIRGVQENSFTNVKSVIGEMKCDKEPTLNEISIFLENSGADFVSVEHNYRFEPDSPFC